MTAFMPDQEFTSRRISDDDLRLLLRLSATVGLIAGFVVAFFQLQLLYSHKFFDATGRAEWIWQRHELARRMPVAFFAVRDFELPANRYYTHIKIAGDPRYTFWLNGSEVGGRATGEMPTLDEYDVGTIARTGTNRLVVAVRSVDGVGGLLAAIDISPETANYIVTGSDWKIFERWNDGLILRDPPDVRPQTPMLLGRPPLRRWNYLQKAAGIRAPDAREVINPSGRFALNAALPSVRIVEGVAVASSERVRATAFEFAPNTAGRLRLILPVPARRSSVVNVRFANNRDELAPLEGNVTPFVFAAGERVALDAEVRHFHYAMVYEVPASVVAVR